MPDRAATRLRYRERLTPPWWGWLLGALWASTLGVAYGYAISALVGWVVFAGLFTLAAVGLWAMSAVIEVDHETLRAGRATLPLQAIGSVTPLGSEAARHTRGTGADPTAYALMRGWVSEAVVVELDDPTDPTPYWYVSSRHPTALADALAQASVTGSGRAAPG